MAQLAGAIEWLLSAGYDLDIVFAKDRYNHPASGYQDLLLNLRLKGDEYTHTAELQLMLQATADLKPNSHRTYALMRLFDGWGWEEEGALLVSLGHRTGVGAMDGVILGRQSHTGDAAPHAAEVVSRTHFLREVWAHSPLAAA